MVGKHIGSDLLLILLNGAGKLMDSDNSRQSDFWKVRGSSKDVEDLIPVVS